MSTVATEKELAPTDQQEIRKGYPTFSGKALAGALLAKKETMLCVRNDEIHLARARQLKLDKGVVTDVTDPLSPRIVTDDEVYHIGWR